MERKAIKNKIGIFTGKQKTHNIQLLTLLYDNEPLTAWELTGKVRKIGRHSLHSTFQKRLRALEKKEYVRKKGKKWFLAFKGIIAILLIQKYHKKWNENWADVFKIMLFDVVKICEPLLGIKKHIIYDLLLSLGFDFDDFNTWIRLSEKTQDLLNKGLANLDIISNGSLLTLIIKESMSLEQISKLVKEAYRKDI